jgi:hypothetical protein
LENCIVLVPVSRRFPGRSSCPPLGALAGCRSDALLGAVFWGQSDEGILQDPLPEDRIHNEAVVDAGPEEQALSWYYCMDNRIHFPFQAKCLAPKVVSSPRKGENVQVLRVAPDDACEHDMIVLLRWQGRKMAAAAQLHPCRSRRTNC